MRIKKPLQKLLRQTGFLTISLVLRLPLWILLFLVRPGKPVGYLFVIYPGHKMVVVGVGHMGGEVIDYLQDQSWEIHGIDIRRHRDGVLLPEEGEKVLAQADMVVVLIPKGSDFAPYMKYLKPGCLTPTHVYMPLFQV